MFAPAVTAHATDAVAALMAAIEAAEGPSATRGLQRGLVSLLAAGITAARRNRSIAGVVLSSVLLVASVGHWGYSTLGRVSRRVEPGAEAGSA